MVLIPQETLARMQASRRLEQTPITRVVHGLDTDMRQLIERPDLSEGEKIKLYQQTLQRYITLNKQRTAPLTMTLDTNDYRTDLDEPPVLKREPTIERTKPSETKPTLKVALKEKIGDDAVNYEELPHLFATASHLPTKKSKKKLSSSGRKQKWTTL